MKKFDLKPYDKVLVREADDHHWKCDLFSHYEEYSQQYVCIGSWYKQCIPYQGNEHLLGTMASYEEPYEPKDGDFVTYVFGDGDTFVTIYREDDWYYVSLKINECLPDETLTYKLQFNKMYVIRRPATEEEKQLLLDKLHKEGVDWDAEKKAIVDYKWMPKKGEGYWSIEFNPCKCFVSFGIVWCDCGIDNELYKKGLVFNTQKEAEKKAQELNEKLFGKEN